MKVNNLLIENKIIIKYKNQKNIILKEIILQQEKEEVKLKEQ